MNITSFLDVDLFAVPLSMSWAFNQSKSMKGTESLPLQGEERSEGQLGWGWVVFDSIG